MGFFVTGDIHGNFKEFIKRIENISKNNNNSIIILGDSGINWYKDDRDTIVKNKLNNLGYRFLIMRGNHDMPPFELPAIKKRYINDIENDVYYEEAFTNILYLIDGNIYKFNNYKCLVLGGAYSIDKEWRISRGGTWFSNEQIPIEERNIIYENIKNIKIDFVLTHTCPISFQPTDLFLNFIDQKQVDNSMEIWLEKIKNNIEWKYWLFGHYHQDRLEKPYVELYYKTVEDINNIVLRWEKYKKNNELNWWENKSPNFYL